MMLVCGRTIAVLATSMIIGCGGDDRSPTAPPLPIVEQDAPCSEYDHGQNGTVDWINTYTYDRDGFVTRITDTDGAVTDIEYDANHFVLHYAANYDADAELEYEATYTRDPDGRVLTSQTRNGTEPPDSEMYTYDDRGRLVKSVSSGTDNGMMFTYTVEYVYTGDRLTPTTARATYSSGTSKQTYTASANELMVHVDFDDLEDGDVDRTSDYTYDEDRRLLTSVTRTGTTVTSRSAYTYNARGSQLTVVFANNDESSPEDYKYTATYTSAGMLMQQVITSPSGEFSMSGSTETFKTTCSGATVTRTERIPRHPRMFAPRDGLLTFAPR